METIITTTSEKRLRSGYTTGTCAACAAGVAVRMLLGEEAPKTGVVTLPDGERVSLRVAFADHNGSSAAAGVLKLAGDDPDDTDGALVVTTVSWRDGPGILYVAGPGVGVVTKPGLSVPVGEAAVNPVPRRMILNAIREVTCRGISVTVSIPGGEELAKKTFNPKLGIKGGLSVLGTSGRVVPYSCPAIRESLCLTVRIAAAGGVRYPVFTPGNIGAQAARRHFRFRDGALLHVSNEWGAVLDEASKHAFGGILVVGHPGKLAKLIDGHFQTHSKHSPSALPIVRRLAQTASIEAPDSPTVEGCIVGLTPEDRDELASLLAHGIQQAVARRAQSFTPSVALVAMNGDLLGTAGELSHWRRTP